ncbi:ribonuclease P protein component [Catenuloplanes nepalensis]|uniref:Ribonuclease P protein component n=1 Tax=Catenuloplanes nepalensis TaxID=587533 RepID=A0ABT9N451_9ACTN|nr:ribonuclease P protein component [Catenuloplanes nepalensis]MDP9798493.1 ribonuclease P protein component [Catenuloplanes nepalensis]
MLAAAQRLRRSSDFAVAIRAGRRAARGSVVVHLHLASTETVIDSTETMGAEGTEGPVRQHETIEPVHAAVAARAGFVVSKAVGNAVVRNRVRRRLRHLVRERLAALPGGATLVVRAQPGAARATYPQLGLDLDAALRAAVAPRARRQSDGAKRRRDGAG